jgi:hypothetical protein
MSTYKNIKIKMKTKEKLKLMSKVKTIRSAIILKLDKICFVYTARLADEQYSQELRPRRIYQEQIYLKNSTKIFFCKVKITL